MYSIVVVIVVFHVSIETTNKKGRKLLIFYSFSFKASH